MPHTKDGQLVVVGEQYFIPVTAKAVYQSEACNVDAEALNGFRFAICAVNLVKDPGSVAATGGPTE